MKAGLRMQLTKEELSRGGLEMRAAEQARKKKGKGIVRQAKIIFEGREGTKVAENSDAGRSRGYGFIEYSSHRWALMGLRWLNGHSVGSSIDSREPKREKTRRLIVEFAIENAQVVMRRQENEAKARKLSKARQEKDMGPPSTKKSYSEAGLTATSSNGTQSKKDRFEGNSTPFGTSEVIAKATDNRLAKRQQVIGRKRMLRKNRNRSFGSG